MVDKPNPTPGSGMEIPGQGAPTAGQTPAEKQGGEGQQFLTREEFQAAFAALDKKWSDSQTRMGAKQADFAQKVQGDLTALKQHIDLMKASGVQITAEQEQVMRNEVIARGFETPQGQHGEPAAQPLAAPLIPDEEVPPDPVTAQAWDMMEEAGVLINVNDPEMQLLDRSSEQAFLESVKPAIEAKIKRLAGTPGTQTPRMPTNLGASGAPANNWYGQLHSPDEIWNGMKNSS